MKDRSREFELLVERADDCGSRWADKILARYRQQDIQPPYDWPGTIAEARCIVAAFSHRVPPGDRERLAQVALEAAEWEWYDRQTVAA